MPALEIKNLKRIKDLAHTLALPIWLVKLLIIEYLPCRRFHGNTVVLDYGLLTASDIKSIAEPYVILNGLTFFHNITDQVLTQRLLAGFGGFPMTGLAKQEPLVSPEGKVSPYCLPFPQMNIDEVEGDYKLRLNLHKRAVVMFTLVDDNRSARRHFRVRSYVEPIFFRAAARAREARKGMDAGEIYPLPIAEEIEASAESINFPHRTLSTYSSLNLL